MLDGRFSERAVLGGQARWDTWWGPMDRGDVAIPPAVEHAVQLYEADPFLGEVAAGFLASGLRLGEGLVVCATAAHRESLRTRLGAGGIMAQEAERDGRLLVCDAEDTLAQILVARPCSWGC